MNTLKIDFQLSDTDGSPIEETLSWYKNEIEITQFNDKLAQESIIDFLDELLIRIENYRNFTK